MSDQISLTGISATGFHGVFPEERRNGQSFIVDVILKFDLAPAGESDELTKTVNYATVAEAVVEAPVAQDATPEVVAEAAPAAESTEN